MTAATAQSSSPKPYTILSATMNAKMRRNQHHRVLIIGSGVIGLTSAYLLLEKGYGVTIVSKEFPSTRRLPKIASEAAGAIWVPPEMMGRHPAAKERPDIADTLKRWSADGEQRYTALAKDSRNTGVSLREVVVFPDEVDQEASLQQYKQIRGFRQSPSLMKEKGLYDASVRIENVYSFVGPVIDSPKFGTWLMQQCIRKGAHIVQGAIRGLLTEQAQALKLTYGVQFIINCSGLGSVELAGDKGMFPMRGALLKARNDGSLFPKIDFCVEGKFTSFGVDEAGQQILGHVYLFPRGEDHLMLGSLIQPNRWDHDLSLSAPYVQSMMRKCKELCPCLHALKDSDCQVTVGIRPGRNEIRLEQDPHEPCIFHNYGHYRWGMTLNWGSAGDIVKLIDNEVMKLAGQPPKHLAKI